MESTTIEKMKKMYLRGMASAYHEDIQTGSITKYTTSEYLSTLIDSEWESRQNRKIKNLKRAAKFRAPNALATNIDFTSPRGLDKDVIFYKCWQAQIPAENIRAIAIHIFGWFCFFNNM